MDLVAIVVDEYEPAIEFFVATLGFELVEDSPATTSSGQLKRWVVVRPSGGGPGLLLARAEGPDQEAVIGQQFAGRVGFVLKVADFETEYARLQAAGVQFVRPPWTADWGQTAVFLDLAGNKWDLIGPVPPSGLS